MKFPINKIPKLLRTYSLLLSFVGLSIKAEAQSINPSVINATGGSFTTDSHILNASIGEITVTSLKGQVNIITQGFLQPADTVVELGKGVHVNFKYYPNPTTSSVRIEVDMPNLSRIMVYNSIGEFIIERPFSDKEINFTNYAAGLYVVNIVDSNNNIALSFKINKL